MTRVFVGMGSNRGERLAFLQQAVTAMRDFPDTEVVQVSSVYDTDPVGDHGHPSYLNAVVEARTDLPPTRFLRKMQDVETRLGRGKTARSGPRTIDLDLLYYGQRIIADPELDVPRPSNTERLFVLLPMTELDPEWVDPLTGLKMGELLSKRGNLETVRWTGRFPL